MPTYIKPGHWITTAKMRKGFLDLDKLITDKATSPNLIHKGYTESGTRAGGDLVVVLGDYDESGTGTAIEISDSSRSIRMGDIQESYNGVVLQIDDSNSNINLFTPIGDVQLHSQGFQFNYIL